MTLTARQERGLVIAATAKLTQRGKVWIVPSQTGSGKRYTVHPDADTPFCSCADFEETGLPCKHLFAVEYTVQRETGKDGTVTETKSVTFTQRKTYKQNWPLYNLAQNEEKKRFLVLLHDLCKRLENVPQPGKGRRWTPMADMIFSCVHKVYSLVSARRFGTEIDEAFEKGFLTRKLHPMMTANFLEQEELTPILQKLVVESSLPLRSVETVFAPDSTGFSCSRHVRWFDEKYGTHRSGRAWVKAHAICGVKTHTITAVEILERHAGDSPLLPALVKTTAENFAVKEVPADKGYLSNENLEFVQGIGATAYIPFKVNSTGGEGGSLWEKMFHYYNLNREQFEKHYHQRSNIESAFSMIKAKFGDSVKSRNETAMKNEALCKFVAHNICVLIMSQIELGIELIFWGEQSAAAVVDVQPVQIMDVVPSALPTAKIEVEPIRKYCACVGA